MFILFVFVKARVQERYNQPGSLELKIKSIELLETMKENSFNSIRLKIKLKELNEEVVQKLDQVMNEHQGKSSIEFFVEDEELKQSVKLFSRKSKVAINSEFLMAIDKFNAVKYELN